MITKRYKPHKYQRAFHNSPARFRTLIAGRRGGKSLGGTVEALRWADKKAVEMQRPTKGMIIAPTYPMLKDVNIPLFMDWCPAGSIKAWNKQDHKIKLVNNSEITFRSGDNPDRLRGVGLDWVWMDEASFMDREVWEVVYPALTDRGGFAWITTTPQGYDWVYEGFYKPAMDKQEDYDTWRYATEENPYIDKDLIEKAKADLSDIMFRQEYLASFEKFEGLVYPDFEETRHVVNVPERHIQDIFFVGLDVGWNHPTAMLLMKEDLNHNLFVLDEERRQQLTAKDISNHLSAMLTRNGLQINDISSFVIDPASKGTQQTSGMSMYDQLVEEGWAFVPGNNDVMAGINRVTRLFREDKLYIGKGCTMLRDEVMNYHWRKWKESADTDRAKPFKLKDDLADTLRYLVMSRPDYFEHPRLDIYGRVVDDTQDLTYKDPEEDDIIDFVEDGGDLIEDMGDIY
jgi:PBSX family phage terminase large subunit